jgi:polysaccharide pyruvyl transferase WcaK-like protein
VAGNSPFRTCLFGTPGAEYNLGVGALRLSLAGGLLRREPAADLTVFDDGWGLRAAALRLADGTSTTYRLAGARNSRRLHRPESYGNMLFASRVRGLGNPGARLVLGADAVLDVSGGDSFADIYGPHRFRTVALPKLLALRAGRPLILLPQTYGPFTAPAIRRRAAQIVRGAHSAWARDADSFAALRELLGDAYDPEHHREGVDMAFALPSVAPAAPEARAEVETLLAGGDPVAGLNVSGLLWNDPQAAARYGLRCDYRAVTLALVRRILADGARILLVPHVLGAEGPIESDTGACLGLLRALDPAERARVTLAPANLDASETKWVISQVAWFAGARMHSTIAGLSSAVATTAIAYSLKFRGVFASCGQQEQVAEARELDDAAMVEVLYAGWSGREATARALPAQVRPTVQRAERQMDTIVDTVRRCRIGRRLPNTAV